MGEKGKTKDTTKPPPSETSSPSTSGESEKAALTAADFSATVDRIAAHLERTTTAAAEVARHDAAVAARRAELQPLRLIEGGGGSSGMDATLGQIEAILARDGLGPDDRTQLLRACAGDPNAVMWFATQPSDTSFEQLLVAARQHFAPGDAAERLKSCKQSDREEHAAFAGRFRSAMVAARRTETAESVRLFVANMCEAVRRTVATANVTSIDAAVGVANEHDRAFRAMASRTAAPTPPTAAVAAATATAGGTTSPADTGDDSGEEAAAMAFGGGERRGDRRQRQWPPRQQELSWASLQRQHLTHGHGCGRCGKLSHAWPDCWEFNDKTSLLMQLVRAARRAGVELPKPVQKAKDSQRKNEPSTR
jgi:hypothetical protein